MKKVINIIGLPASGKGLYGRKLAEEMGFKFIEEAATQLIGQPEFKSGSSATFRFDRIVLEKNKETAKNILNSTKKDVFVLEGGPILDRWYCQARANLGKYKQERMSLLAVYEDPVFNELNQNSIFVIFNLPPGVSLSRREERNGLKFDDTELQILQFVHDNLLKFHVKNKENVVFINLMGKTEEQVYEELRTKLLAMPEKEAK